MSSFRWAPILGILVALAIVPGALAHGCNGGSSPPGDELTAQSISPPPAPLAIAAFLIVPLVGLLMALAIAIPSIRNTKPAEGVWQFNGMAYVWVPARK
jgi:hypothetical protein